MTQLGFTIVRGTEIVFRDDAENGRLGVSLLRTLRLPDDGVRYPLPPGMGPLPVRRVSDLAGRVPPEWLTRPGVVVPMYRCEAIWLLFSADHPLPHAVKVGCGGINALSGRPLSRRLERPVRPGLWRRALGALPAQDYAVCPPQQFIDGFNTGHHSVRQFVAVPLGEGRTVEAQLTGREQHGGIQLCVYPPRRELEAALASAGRQALPALAPVTAGSSVPETETAAWEWDGPGAAVPPPTPPMPLRPPESEFAPDGMQGTTVDLVGPAGSPDGAHAATVDLGVPAASPDGAHTATVDLGAPAGSPDGAHAATVASPDGAPAALVAPAGSPDGAHATMVDLVPPVMDPPATPSVSAFRTTLRGHAANPSRAEAPNLARDEVEHTVRGHASSAGHNHPPGARSAGPAPARDPLIGTVLDGRYEIQACIGEGRMGVVYRAREISIDRVLALKLYHPQLADDPAWIQRYLKEAKAWSRLQHPNTARVFAAGQTSGGRPFVARELLDGVSLRAALSNGPLAPLRVVKILIQCCASLAEAHAIGTLHRNVKPDNVFLLDMAGSPDFVKLSGFSVPRLAEREPRTPNYLSPEQARGLLLDARSDLYALGILAFELLTGRVPELPVHLLSAIPAMPDTVPYVVQQIVRRALEKNPDSRYQSAGEVMLDCQHVFGDVTEVVPAMLMPSEPPSLPDERPVGNPGRPMLTIVIEQPGHEPRRMMFNKPEVQIGRVYGNDIVLPDSKVSKRHARIVTKDGKFIIVDLKSTHGTYVNGRKISNPLVVRASDKIFIHDFRISVDEAASAEGGDDWGSATTAPAERAPDARPPRPTEAQPMPPSVGRAVMAARSAPQREPPPQERAPRSVEAQPMPPSAMPTADAIDDQRAVERLPASRAQPAMFGGPNVRDAPTMMAEHKPAMPAPAMPAPATPSPAMPLPGMSPPPVQRGMPAGAMSPPPIPRGMPESAMSPSPVQRGMPESAMSPSPVQRGMPESAMSPSPAQRGMPAGAMSPPPVPRGMPAGAPPPAQRGMPVDVRPRLPGAGMPAPEIPSSGMPSPEMPPLGMSPPLATRGMPRGVADGMPAPMMAPPPQSPTAQASPYGRPQPAAQASPYGQPQPAAQANPYGQPQPAAQANPFGQPAYAEPYSPQGGGYPQAMNPFSSVPESGFPETLGHAEAVEYTQPRWRAKIPGLGRRSTSAPVEKRSTTRDARVQPVVGRPMGLGAGGQISQRIYSDVYGIETWDEAACTELFIHIVSPETWYAMTGEPPPPTPVTFRAYQAAGLPWFQIYDEDRPGIAASPELGQIRPIDDFDRRR